MRRLRPRNERGDADRLSSLTFSPDGEEIAAAGSSQIYVWEVETGKELLKIEQGADYGWPTCYFDNVQHKLVLAPEYGGDGGKAVGDCAHAAE